MAEVTPARGASPRALSPESHANPRVAHAVGRRQSHPPTRPCWLSPFCDVNPLFVPFRSLGAISGKREFARSVPAGCNGRRVQPLRLHTQTGSLSKAEITTTTTTSLCDYEAA